MKTIIFLSGPLFPASVVAGAIYLKKLPPQYSKFDIWKTEFSKYILNKMPGYGHFLGDSPYGTRVLAFSAPSTRPLLTNLINTFLAINDVNKDCYRVIVINAGSSVLPLLGQILLLAPLTQRIGRFIIDRYLKNIYPMLAEAVKLDCDFQISDN